MPTLVVNEVYLKAIAVADTSKELYRVIGSIGKVIVEVLFDIPYGVTTILVSVGFQAFLK